MSYTFGTYTFIDSFADWKASCLEKRCACLLKKYFFIVVAAPPLS